MQVKITYPDRRFTALFAALTLLFVYVLLKYAVTWAVFAVFICFVLAFLTNMMPGSCKADEESVTIKKIFGSQKLRYEDIEWVYTDLKKGTTTRGSSTISVIYELNIVAKQGTISCRGEHGRIPHSGMLFDTQYRQHLLDDSPFGALERYIKERINASPR